VRKVEREVEGKQTMNNLLVSGALSSRVEASMKKLHFLFLLMGGLMILGCPLLGVGGGERRADDHGLTFEWGDRCPIA
jgi:hypothetical protein